MGCQVRTLACQQLERGHNTFQPIAHVAARATRCLLVGLGLGVLVRCPGDEILEDLHEVLEEIDVHQVRVSRDAPQRGREKRRRLRVFQNPKVENKEELECLRLLYRR